MRSNEPKNLTEKIDLPSSPEVIEFLASTLSVFMEIDRLNNQSWTKIRVSEAISKAEDIEGTIDDTTLGRFLDPDYPQAPSTATVNKIAAFLLKMNCVTRVELRLIGSDLRIRQLSLLNQLLWAQSNSGQDEFYAELDGYYLSASFVANYLLISHLVMTRVSSGNNALKVKEVICLYKIGVPEQFRFQTNDLSFEKYDRIAPALRACGGEFVREQTSVGIASANADIALMLVQKDGENLSTVLNVTSISYSEEDQVEFFTTFRNSGWTTVEVNDESGPAINDGDSISTVTKTLSFQQKYKRIDSSSIRSISFAKNQDNVIEYVGYRQFKEDKYLSIIRGNMDNDQNKLDNFKGNPNEILLKSIESSDISMFQLSLDAGADANIVPPGKKDPLIFYFAFHGQVEWAQALIATGRCDLTIRSNEGFRASHHPGITAREFAQHPEAEELRDQFSYLRKILLDEEIRQVRQLDNEGSPPDIA